MTAEIAARSTSREWNRWMRRRWRSTFTPHSPTSFETAEATQEDDPVLRCVGERVHTLAGSLPHTFSADQLRALFARFRRPARSIRVATSRAIHNRLKNNKRVFEPGSVPPASLPRRKSLSRDSAPRKTCYFKRVYRNGRRPPSLPDGRFRSLFGPFLRRVVTTLI